MDEVTRTELEANGIDVIVQPYPDPHFKTRTFIRLDGLDLPWYDYLFQVPHLNNNDQYTMPLTAVPSEAQVTNLRTALWDDIVTYETTADGQTLVIEWMALAILMIKLIGTILIFICIYYVLEKIFAPCGITGSEIPINLCWKKVIMPDCKWKTINSCADPDGDGIPEGEWGEDEWQGGTDWATWLIIGLVAIGVIVIAPPLIRAIKTPPK